MPGSEPWMDVRNPRADRTQEWKEGQLEGRKEATAQRCVLVAKPRDETRCGGFVRDCGPR